MGACFDRCPYYLIMANRPGDTAIERQFPREGEDSDTAGRREKSWNPSGGRGRGTGQEPLLWFLREVTGDSVSRLWLGEWESFQESLDRKGCP